LKLHINLFASWLTKYVELFYETAEWRLFNVRGIVSKTPKSGTYVLRYPIAKYHTHLTACVYFRYLFL